MGRLSMWRAYGGQDGVAIVMNNAAFLRPSDALKAWTNPVEYLTPSEFEDRAAKWVNRLGRHRSFLATLDQNTLVAYVLEIMKQVVLCNKHPGFREEKEWRIIYTPHEQASDRLKTEIKIINGVPQRIVILPLTDVPEENHFGLDPASLIERIIIGPCRFPHVVGEALHSLLHAAGCPTPTIIASDIPLRAP